jgi:hypothetical protein
LVLLYSMVSAQLSYNPHGSKLYMYDLQATTSFRVLTSHADAAYAGGAAIINAVPAKRERSHEEQGMYCMLDCPGESMELHHLLKNRCTCRGWGSGGGAGAGWPKRARNCQQLDASKVRDETKTKSRLQRA